MKERRIKTKSPKRGSNRCESRIYKNEAELLFGIWKSARTEQLVDIVFQTKREEVFEET